MKRTIFIVSIFILLSNIDVNAQDRRTFGIEIGPTIQLGKVAKLYDENRDVTDIKGSIGAVVVHVGNFSWDAVFTNKDAMGFFYEGQIYWQSIKETNIVGMEKRNLFGFTGVVGPLYQ